MAKQYKVYVDGKDACVQALNGKWYSDEHRGNCGYSEEYDLKPKRFKSYKTLTLEEIRYNYCELDIRTMWAKSIMDGGNLKETAESFRKFAKYLENCRKDGWELGDEIVDGDGWMTIPLKPI